MKTKLQLVLFAAWTGFASASVLHPLGLTFNRTEQSGIVTMRCRNTTTADELDTATVHFWLNRTSTNDSDLRERDDVLNIVDDHFSIQFNLTRNLEGSYTCGRRCDADNLQESNSLILICKLNSCILCLVVTRIMQLFKHILFCPYQHMLQIFTPVKQYLLQHQAALLNSSVPFSLEHFSSTTL